MPHCNSRGDTSLVILAAGLGRRFGGEKQLATIGETGRPLMYFSVMDAWRSGVRKLVLVVSPGIEPLIRKRFLPMLPGDLEISIVFQKSSDLPAACHAVPREKPWGTGHALWSARTAVEAACIVINADDYYGPQAMTRLLSHLEESADWAMASYPLEKTLSGFGTVNRGLCRVRAGFLEGVSECHDIKRTDRGIRGVLDGRAVSLEPDAPVSMNAWAFGRNVFDCLERGMTCFFADREVSDRDEFYLPSQVMASIKSGAVRVQVYASSDDWHGVTYREDLALIGDFVAGGN